MNLHQPTAMLVVPDGKLAQEALARATHLAIGTHPDDIEFMTWNGILQCFAREDKWFSGITVTHGSGSSRIGEYAAYSDSQMMAVRHHEQEVAAVAGGYAFLGTLGYSSAELRGPERVNVKEDLCCFLRGMHPEVIYTHNIADRHDSHIATAVSVIEALREVGPEHQPREFWGCEVWRSLDWLTGSDRGEFDVSEHPNLTMALMGVYDSQIAGGKRYDLATAGRRQANATYNDAYKPDAAKALELGMDLMPLLRNPHLDIGEYLRELIANFQDDALARLKRALS